MLRVSTVATFGNAVSVMNISGVSNQYHRPKKYEIIQFLSTYSVDSCVDSCVDSRVDTCVDTCVALTKHKQKHKLKHKQNINKSSS